MRSCRKKAKGILRTELWDTHIYAVGEEKETSKETEKDITLRQERNQEKCVSREVSYEEHFKEEEMINHYKCYL